MVLNKTYTSKYLIQDLTNKQFRRKYGKTTWKHSYPEPIINETNKESWKDKILSKNPWMGPKEPMIPYEDYQHLQSITGKDRTVGVIE